MAVIQYISATDWRASLQRAGASPRLIGASPRLIGASPRLRGASPRLAGASPCDRQGPAIPSSTGWEQVHLTTSIFNSNCRRFKGFLSSLRGTKQSRAGTLDCFVPRKDETINILYAFVFPLFPRLWVGSRKDGPGSPDCFIPRKDDRTTI
jgi:hypothetical protein